MPTSARNTSDSDPPRGQRFRFLLNSETDQGTSLLMMCAVSFLFLTFFSLSAQLFSCRHKPLEVEHSTQTGETNSSNTPSAGSPYLVDINTAGIHELSILPGIGEITAGKIIAERNANGPFRSTEDLQRVHGIGRKKIEALEAMVAPIAVSRLAEAAPVSDTPTKPST